MARYSGNFGAVYVKVAGVFTKILDVYDWTFNAETTNLRVDIKGDAIERWIPSHASGVKFTAKRRSEGTFNSFPIFVGDSATNATQTTWRLDLIDNNSSFIQITGNGYAESTSINSPQGDAVDETFGLQFDDSYSFNH